MQYSKNVKIDNIFPTNPILIGKNQKGNDEILKSAKPDDLWFHLANLPSCHAIMSIPSEDDTVTLKSKINYCVNLVKQNTKFKNAKNIKVDCLAIKYIKLTSIPGEVILMKKPKTYKI